jgi:hypothetical protein
MVYKICDSMHALTYRNRRAFQIENSVASVIITAEGGHVAGIFHKPTGVNPLWSPPWPTIEPSSYNPVRHPEYGLHNEARLLSGILGHNICLDTFGAPSAEEAAAGVPVHGEAPIATYEVRGGPDWIEGEVILSKAQIRFKRRISLASDAIVVRFSEEVENLSSSDRPIAWTQHVTIGPPFLERGRTQLRTSATRSKVIGPHFNEGKSAHASDREFEWPLCPMKDGTLTDLSVFTAAEISGGFTAHLMNPEREHAWFAAWSPTTDVLLGYVWKRADFPWLARWEENHLRDQRPWNGNGLACGMEFGVSPFGESRREMVARGSLFGTPTFRWLPAQTRLSVDYAAFITTRKSIAESLTWDGRDDVSLD